MWVDGPDDGAECLSVVSGSGLLSQYGDHAPGREAPQRDDRPPAEEGTEKPDDESASSLSKVWDYVFLLKQFFF